MKTIFYRTHYSFLFSFFYKYIFSTTNPSSLHTKTFQRLRLVERACLKGNLSTFYIVRGFSSPPPLPKRGCWGMTKTLTLPLSSATSFLVT